MGCSQGTWVSLCALGSVVECAGTCSVTSIIIRVVEAQDELVD